MDDSLPTHLWPQGLQHAGACPPQAVSWCRQWMTRRAVVGCIGVAVLSVIIMLAMRTLDGDVHVIDVVSACVMALMVGALAAICVCASSTGWQSFHEDFSAQMTEVRTVEDVSVPVSEHWTRDFVLLPSIVGRGLARQLDDDSWHARFHDDVVVLTPRAPVRTWVAALHARGDHPIAPRATEGAPFADVLASRRH